MRIDYNSDEISIYRGHTWTVYPPGEDERFKKNWVTRDASGVLKACVNTYEQIITNAKLCEVMLIYCESYRKSLENNNELNIDV